MEKKKRHYPLDEIKKLVEKVETRVITGVARDNAAAMGMDDNDMNACIQALTQQDFFKSMPRRTDRTLWQDVYRPTYQGKALYVKLQIGHDGKGVVVQFKAK